MWTADDKNGWIPRSRISQGGLKAVVWTDTLQTVLMYFGVIFVLAYGTWRLGGISNVIDINKKGDRLDFFKWVDCFLKKFVRNCLKLCLLLNKMVYYDVVFSMDLDPTIRHTFWSTVFGNYFSWLASCSVNQAMVQRCLALSSLRRARM